jgi:ubiquinone biosynthesis protein UbiJ
MPSPQIFTALIESAANQGLKWSSNGESLLAPLLDKSCIIYIQEIESAFIFRFSERTVSVGADVDNLYGCIPEDDSNTPLQSNECWVSVSMFALDKLKQNSQMTKLIKQGKLDFSGDLGILQSLSRLFDKIEIDFEEVLSKFIGDAPAYQANTSGKKIAKDISAQMTSFMQTFADAALDEKPIAVRPIMVLNFSDDVNQLRADADRLEAKLEQLEAKMLANEQAKPKQGKV